MINLIRRILLKFVSYLNKYQLFIASRRSKPKSLVQTEYCKKWFRDKGDETLRLDYNLDKDSIIFDIGGYKGEFARDIFCKYNSNIFIFEPVPEFFNEINQRFIRNGKVNVYNFGLGSKNQKSNIYLDNNGSSLYKKASNSIEIEIRSFNDFINENKIERIDLIKINIEGSEYDLLESIIEAGNISKIHNIQVQFHDYIIDNAFERMRLIQNRLSETHHLTFQYEFVWENWELNG